MKKSLRTLSLRFLFYFRPGNETVPFLEERKLLSFYVLVLASLAGIPFNARNMLTDGYYLSAYLQGLYLCLLVLSLLFFWIFRTLSAVRHLVAAALIVLFTDIILSGGTTYGIGAFYVVPALPAVYFILGFRSVVALGLYFMFGFLIRSFSAPFPETSLFFDAEPRLRSLAALWITGGITCSIVFQVDRLFRSLTKAAFYDQETGLSGQWRTRGFLERFVEQADAEHNGFCAVGVRILNDTRLNAMLDAEEIAQSVRLFSERLKDASPLVKHLGRWNPSLFLIVLGTDDFLEADSFCRGLLTRLEDSIVLESGRESSILANAMVTRYPEDAADADDLIGNILSLQDKGRSLPNEIIFFRQEDLQKERDRFRLTEALLHADFDREMTLHYQPKLDLKSGRCSGAEVLVRWTHPVLGAVSPADFIPLAEESGLVKRLTRWIIERVFQDISTSAYAEADPGRALVHAVNLSVHDLKDETLVPFLMKESVAHGFEPGMFEFEITEGVMVDNNPWIALNLQHLREQGFGLAIDDFGTGYSSLSYLHRLKVDNLKIDQSFVRALAPGGGGNSVLDAIISMALALGLTITAEGAETAEQAAYLRNKGCHILQGWHYSKSLSFSEYLEFLSSRV